MTPVKVYLDEDVHHLIAHALRLRGWDALTTIAAGRQGSSDLEQLRFAAENGYAILTYNVSDFPRLHYEIIDADDHGGIVVATQDDPSANARTLLSLLSAFSSEDIADQLIFLNNWM
ncbi:MAG: DUF5615 family PIN-like protein [Planctomycetes bacterium]|nr:DUF5615 family PIN-like protein [Planctomycetota bacterium]MBL7041766.1 DUF5615 family PIN-like protein [Pirellulaceae bacterium]